MKRPAKLPRDFSQRAKAIVDLAMGNPIVEEPQPIKNINAVALGALGAAKGGRARAAKLSAKKRKEIAKKAAEARWKKRSD